MCDVPFLFWLTLMCQHTRKNAMKKKKTSRVRDSDIIKLPFIAKDNPFLDTCSEYKKPKKNLVLTVAH